MSDYLGEKSMSHEMNVVLNRTLLVKIDACIYGARKKLTLDDLVLTDGSRLPPAELASLGSKRLMDPERLSIFNRLKKEAERICLRVGTRFLGGFLIPEDKAESICLELERILADFNQAKSDFLTGYYQAVEDWADRHSEFRETLSRAIDPPEHVARRLSFDYCLVRISLPDEIEVPVSRPDSLQGGLGEQLFHEISIEARQLMEDSLLGKHQATQHVIRPVRRIRDKLDGLSFLDHRVLPLLENLDQLLLKLPVKGSIDGSHFQELLASVLLLSDPLNTRKHGQGLMEAPLMSPETTADFDSLHRPSQPIPLSSATGHDYWF